MAREAESGLGLFQRGAHGIRPTPAAELLSERAGDALGAPASLQEAVREIATGTRGRVGLGCLSTPAKSSCRAPSPDSLGPSETSTSASTTASRSCSCHGWSKAISISSWSITTPRPEGLACWPTQDTAARRGGEAPGAENYQSQSGPVQLADFANASWISTRAGSAAAEPPRDHRCEHPPDQQTRCPRTIGRTSIGGTR
jgi:hypothetical protein